MPRHRDHPAPLDMQLSLMAAGLFPAAPAMPPPMALVPMGCDAQPDTGLSAGPHGPLEYLTRLPVEQPLAAGYMARIFGAACPVPVATAGASSPSPTPPYRPPPAGLAEHGPRPDPAHAHDAQRLLTPPLAAQSPTHSVLSEMAPPMLPELMAPMFPELPLFPELSASTLPGPALAALPHPGLAALADPVLAALSCPVPGHGAAGDEWAPGRGGACKAKKRQTLTREQRTVLYKWLIDNIHHPYPKDSDRIALTGGTMDRQRFKWWFSNHRHRNFRSPRSRDSGEGFTPLPVFIKSCRRLRIETPWDHPPGTPECPAES
ncbi:hypothetical protein H4R18_002353 [Coemansia javaensis]|uniref:Homeobox domain-containing protein n=1 Tax=Coemansia javaensis TaxID=2761396 RepID=A0A9W8HH09_9FUNG|nr:hypothetical protein H4R18_002353 [Coemansia javaensis]